MLVVISDLHMEAESRYMLPGIPPHAPLQISRNLSPRAYDRVFADLAYEAQRNRAQEMHLVLAGDILEINRSPLWFRDSLRPYTSSKEVGPDLEQRVMDIIDDIAIEPAVEPALAAIRRLVSGRYLLGSREHPFPVPVTVHFIPGNHDRLANATPRLRRKVRRLFGMADTAEPFHNVLLFEDERVMVRHGHEYDPYNFSIDYRHFPIIPPHLPAAAYAEPVFGDYVTCDVAVQIPLIMRQRYGHDAIVANPMLRALYRRVIGFDDLRPRTALIPYLMHTPIPGADPEETWNVIAQLTEDMLEAVHDDPFLLEWLDRIDRKWHLDMIDALQAVFDLKAWRWAGVPRGLAERITEQALKATMAMEPVEHIADREHLIQTGDVLFVVAGHTHSPQVSLLENDQKGERYYINTGTWRPRITTNAPVFTAFGELKTLTYVIMYGQNEDLGGAHPDVKIASVDAWTGFSQRW